MIARLRLSIWHGLLALIVIALLGSCTTGGGDPDPDPNDPNAPVPSIFGLSKSSANPGETLTIFGQNFGENQAGGSVSLGGVTFIITRWTDTEIDVQVAPSMTSGIIVVEKEGKFSINGQEAQLFIGEPPVQGPVIYTVTPDFGRIAQDVVSIIGTGFGLPAEGSGVFFTANLQSGLDFVEAEVVNNAATNQPQWTATNIRVRIPADARLGTHELFVQVGADASNRIAFEALPPIGQLGDPVINDITPMSGPIDTEIILTGNNFGVQQGSSTLTIGGADDLVRTALEIVNWTNTQITAKIAPGSETGKIRVVVAGRSFEFPTDFVVANVPEITGVAPSELRIGQSVTIHGQFFGTDTGTVRFAGTEMDVTTWGPNMITIEALESFTAPDVDNVPVVVEAASGLESSPFMASLTSDLIGSATVDPKTGIATKTTFNFTLSAAGGTGNYNYTLIPDTSNPSQTKGNSSDNTITHVYDTQGVYNTAIRIKDNGSGDIAQFPGPTITVGAADDVVITGIEAVNFASPTVAENAYSFVNVGGNPVYHDFVFPAGQIFYNTGTVDLQDGGGNPLQAFLRDQASFLHGSTNPRPYGYRRAAAPAQGGTVRVRGLNFGPANGEVWLNSSAPGNGVQIADSAITLWGTEGGEDVVEFTLPHDYMGHLNGTIVIKNSDTDTFGQSIDPLIVSPVVSSTVPGPPNPATMTGNLRINGFDLAAPAGGIEGIAGTQTYLFWVVQANYTDPFTNNPASNQVLVMTPFPVNVTTSATSAFIDFDMNRLAGPLTVEVFDTTGGTGYGVAQDATPQNGTWQFFVWSGALPADGSVPFSQVANSGVFGVPHPIDVGAGGPGNQNPIVSIDANPTNGASPLSVDFTINASDPDGTVDSVEIDFDDPKGSGTFVDTTGDLTPSHTFSPAATTTYNVTVRATDNLGATSTDTVNVTVTVGGGGPTHYLQGFAGFATAPPSPGEDTTMGFDDGAVTIEVVRQSDMAVLGSAATGSIPPPAGAPDDRGYWRINNVPEIPNGDTETYIMRPTVSPAPSGDDWVPAQVIVAAPFEMDIEGYSFLDPAFFF